MDAFQMINILYIAGREIDYTRNNVLLRALQRLGNVEVIGEIGAGSILRRSIRFTLKAFPRLFRSKYDLIFVGFYGHFLMLSLGLMAKTPILFDVFVSTYDTMSFDRGQFSHTSPRGRLAFWLDRTACRLADHILLDTQYHVQYFVDTFGLSPTKFNTLPVGCNENLFHPQPVTVKSGITHILYYSSYLPLHGVETIIKAAALLKTKAIHFKLIGAGQEYDNVYKLAQTLNLTNVIFTAPIPLTRLPEEIAQADICLGGHFGTSDKAQRVIPGKIYQILAMGRPLIAANTPANQELLSHAETAYLCPPDNAESLASAILTLHQNTSLRERLGQKGRLLYENQCSEAIITSQLRRIINDIKG